MSKPERRKIVLRRQLKRPGERAASSPSLLRWFAYGVVGVVLLWPFFVLAPWLTALVAGIQVHEVRRFRRRSRLRSRLLRLRLWLRGDAIVTCPLCHDLVVEGEDELSDCAGCSVRYHTECRDELGGCATLGCPERASRRQAPKAKLEA